MKEFTENDWKAYSGAEQFKDGSPPQIARLNSHCEMIADGHGVWIVGTFVNKDINYELFIGHGRRKVTLEIAKEWEKELTGMGVKNIILLMHALGY